MIDFEKWNTCFHVGSGGFCEFDSKQSILLRQWECKNSMWQEAALFLRNRVPNDYVLIRFFPGTTTENASFKRSSVSFGSIVSLKGAITQCGGWFYCKPIYERTLRKIEGFK